MRGNTLSRAALAASALCVACTLCFACTDAGTSTGNPAPHDHDSGPPREIDHGSSGGLAGGGYCTAGDKTPLALDEASPLGFSPNDLLAFAAGTHEEAIHWNEPMSGLSYGPESGQGEITITITPKGTARHVEPAPPGGRAGGGAEPAIDLVAVDCSSWVEIDVHVAIESAGGAIDESFETVLRGHTPHMASLYASFKPETLNGSFVASGESAFGELVLGGVQLALRFSSLGVSGTFAGWLTTSATRDGSASNGPALGGGPPFAVIGAASCIGDGFAVGASDEVEGATVQDALDLLAEHAEIAITWEDGATTTSSFTFAPATGGGCVLLDDDQLGDVTLVIDGTLSMTSADERLDGSFTGRFEAHIDDDGAITHIAFRVDGTMMSNVALGGGYYGFPGIDISSYDAAGTALDITVTSEGLEGTISLVAYTFECGEQPSPDEPEADPGTDPDEGSGGMSTPGCAGALPTELATGVLK